MRFGSPSAELMGGLLIGSPPCSRLEHGPKLLALPSARFSVSRALAPEDLTHLGATQVVFSFGGLFHFLRP
jgi:hypothetical protein